jgi:hypothetical protein
MSESDSIRAFAARNWRVADRDAGSFPAGRGQLRAQESLRVSGLLWQHMKAVRPDWPGAESRAADLEHHIRIKALLDRANRDPDSQ